MSLKGCYFFAFFIIFSFVYWLRLERKLKLPFQTGDKIKISRSLTQEPIIKGEKQYFKIKGILIRLPRYPELHYGDQIEVVGVVEKRKSKLFLNQYQLVNPQASLRSSPVNTGLNLLKNIFDFRRKLEQILNQVLPEPHSGLISGIFLGVQKSLSNDFYEALKVTGTLHIIVASGMNISLSAGALADFLSKFLSKKPALIVSLVCILIYCIMAGMSPPIVRAGLMAGVLYLSNFIGREAQGFWILILTGTVMLIINPLILFDVGFQLSFAATTGLITISSAFEKILIKIPFIKKVSSEIAETLSAMIFTFPILIITFGHFNPLSIIPNIFILPLVPYLFYLGMLICFSGLLFFPLARFFGLLIWFPLTYMIKTINFFGQFKFFHFQLENLSWVFGLGYYLVLITLLPKRKKRG